jgi:hypothetical protein
MIRSRSPLVFVALAAGAAALVAPASAHQQARALGAALSTRLPESTGPTYYVSPAGSDSAPGTLEQPWRTLTKAAGAAGPGSIVLLRAGVYPEWTTLSRSGTSTAPITFRSFSGERATITGRLKITGSYVRVSDFRFLGRTSANPDQVLIYVSGGDHIEISGSELTGAAMSAIYIGDPGNGADDVQFLANYVHDNGTHTNLDHGIYYGTGRGGLIADNFFERNYAYGVHLYPDADGVVVTQNTVVGNGRSGVIVAGESMTSDDNVIVNNVIGYNADYGVRSYWGGPTGSGNLVENNVVYGNPAGNLAGGQTGAGLTYVGNVLSDPLFVDRNARNYGLTAASPALDRGLVEFMTPTDLEGTARPQGAAGDLGALERFADDPSLPVNVQLPAVSGTPVQGQSLSVTSGGWTGSAPITYAYRWQRCAPGCVDIGGAATSTYTLTAADVGVTVRAVVTASNVAGAADAASSETAVVTAAPPPPPPLPPSGDIAHRSTVSSAFSSGRFRIPVPAGTQAGDLILVAVGADAERASLSAPSGWSQLAGSPVSDDQRVWVYYRVASSSEPASYRWSVKKGRGVYISASYSGVDPSDPIDASASGHDRAQGPARSHTTPPLTTTLARTLLLGVWFADESELSGWTPPDGMTEHADLQDASSYEVGSLADWLQTLPATVSATATLGTDDVAAMFLIALRPKAS